MYPELLKIGPITIYSYGLMLGIAFLAANLLLTAELRRRKLDAAIGTNVTMIALVAGIAGAKIFHLIENAGEFFRHPVEMAFSSGGLTWYGGFLLALLLIWVYVRRTKRLTFLQLADYTAPGMALAYGIARIGCHLAGDGDYGIPTNLPWKVSYEYGTSPTAYTLDPASGARIPTEWVHPTPVYELILAVALFTFLHLRRKRNIPAGNQFAWFLILHSLSRFLVEFIRVNPRLILGLSEAQLISIPLILWGVYAVLKKPAARAAAAKS